MDLVELASGVSPACDFVDRSTFIEMVEASVGIGLECASTGTGVSSAWSLRADIT
jgi:hypothetical protein